MLLMKSTIDITHPYMALTCDEVGCNISQKGDGDVGRETFICAQSDEPMQSTSNKNSHFTCLGLTTFDGKPVMCVVLLTGKKRDVSIETGIDTSIDEVDMDVEEGKVFEYFEKNYGEGQIFPGGPTCTFNGKEVPCFVRFAENGGGCQEKFLLTSSR